MRAAVVEEIARPLAIREVPDPQCRPDAAIVEVAANGICRTDWHLWTGDWAWRGLEIEPPFVLGHEFAGTVVEVGSATSREWVGTRVTYPMNPGDGTCAMCRGGHQHVCEHGAELVPGVAFGGAFGRYVEVRHADVNLVALPEELSFVAAAGLGCRYVAAFHGLVDGVDVRGGETVVVYGAGGGMGLSAVQIASALGAEVIAVDVADEPLRMARSLGAAHVVDARAVDAVTAVRELTRGGAHVSVDALGIAETCASAVRSLRRRGRHLQLGHTTTAERGEVALPIDEILLGELRIAGAFGMAAHRYPEMLEMIRRGALAPERVVGRTVGLAGVTGVLQAMGSYGTAGIAVIDDYS